MKKHILVNLSKYGVALGLMAWVIWSNWGDPRGTVGKIVVGGEPDRSKIAGKVLSYQPDESIRIERLSSESEDAGQPVEFALKPKGKTTIVSSNGETLKPGAIVTLSGISRGLAYVWQRNVQYGEPIHSGYLLLAFIVGFASAMLTLVRWYILVRAVELPFRVLDAFRLGFIGLFFNNFMPGSVGGDVIKAAVLAREQDRRTVAVATVLMDRAIALWALAWFVALMGAGFWMSGLLVGQGAEQCRKIVAIAWTIVGLSVLAWIALGLLPDWRAKRFAGRLERLPKVGTAVAELWRAVWMYRCRPRAVGGVLLLSWVGHVGFVFLFYCSVLTLWQPDSGEQIPTLAQHFLIVPIGLVIQAAPFFPGGAGIGELGFGLLYQWLGCSEASGVLGSLVQRVVNWTLGLLGGLMYLRMRATLQSALRREEITGEPAASAGGVSEHPAADAAGSPAVEGRDMRVDFYGLVLETPRVTVYLWSPWRAAALEHRLFESIRSLPRVLPEEGPDEVRLHLDDPKTCRAALQAVARVLKGWQEEADPGSERRSWRWLLEGDTDADGYDHTGEPVSLWGFLRVTLERGGPGETEKGEDIDLEGFGLQVWGEGQT